MHRNIERMTDRRKEWNNNHNNNKTKEAKQPSIVTTTTKNKDKGRTPYCPCVPLLLPPQNTKECGGHWPLWGAPPCSGRRTHPHPAAQTCVCWSPPGHPHTGQRPSSTQTAVCCMAFGQASSRDPAPRTCHRLYLETSHKRSGQGDILFLGLSQIHSEVPLKWNVFVIISHSLLSSVTVCCQHLLFVIIIIIDTICHH